ncbi:MAG: glutamate-5-semialdehyde dehydrogenase [Candidatus Omnitrophota bacterium]|jgi:glutamate-5-semialdehyde dehydrogenase|nr:MAG: glutamate-5-semialdehyde dehydrogenase [Candidatus Omnitrophota bacterium]
MELKKYLTTIGKLAKEASYGAMCLSTKVKNLALKDMAKSLCAHNSAILKANARDVRAALKKKLPLPLIDRLQLNAKRIRVMADSLAEIATLDDPVGEVLKAWRRPNGLWIHKVRVPIGVIAIIYESRPNVTSDCIGLCVKSGNSVILRGGSEAMHSNLSIYASIKGALKKHRIHEGMVNMVSTCDRKALDVLLRLNEYIDLVMPRGGEGLIKRVMQISRIPVIKHYKGICAVYVDESADVKMAKEVCFNAKVQRPGVCNAMETMLVHRRIAKKFLPSMLADFRKANVEIRGCPYTRRLFKGAKAATQADYRTEFLGLILSVKVVKDVAEATAHINTCGTHHSDSIITEDYRNALSFLRNVDSACVYVNASTRFTDGYQFGMGAEVGISTDKLHARGPMALEELTTYKYMVFGKGQVRTELK